MSTRVTAMTTAQLFAETRSLEMVNQRRQTCERDQSFDEPIQISQIVDLDVGWMNEWGSAEIFVVLVDLEGSPQPWLYESTESFA